METTSDGSPRWYRRLSFRISLRALILLVLGVGGGLGWFVHRVEVQRRAVVAIEKAGGRVEYDWTYQAQRSGLSPRRMSPGWLVDLIGIDYFANVTMADDGRGLDDEALERIGRLDHLQVLSLLHSEPTDAGLASLQGNIHLKKLEVNAARATADGLASLGRLRELEEFQFLNARLNDRDLGPIAGMSSLRELKLSFREGSTITDAGLAQVESLRYLNLLEFDGAVGVTGAGLAGLSKLGKLGKLSIQGSSATNLDGLRPMLGLRILDLSGVPLPDQALARVSEMFLVNLSLKHNPALTDAGLAHLEGNRNLQSIDLRGTRITDAGIARLARCPNLVRLSLAGTEVGDAGIASLAAVEVLSTLDLGGTRVSPEAIQAAKAAHPGIKILTP